MSGFFKRMSGMLSGWATACETGQLDRVDQFLSSTSNVPTAAEVSRGLVSACRWGHVSLVLRLLQLPVEPPSPSYKGPLRPSVVDPIPCEGGSAAAASGAGGGGPQPPGVVTETAVGVACQGGHTDVVRLLMREPGADSAAGTLLMFACQGGHSDIVDMLLEKPLSSVTPEEIGRSFVAACKAGFYGIAAALIALNPPHMRPNLAFAAGTGETPLCAACGAGVLEVVNLLLETMGSSTVYAKEICERFVVACKGGHIDVVNKFLSLPRPMRPSLNHISKLERTALSAACEAGHQNIVELLLREEQDVNLGNALWHASKNNRLEIVERLLRHPNIAVNKIFPCCPVLISRSALIPPRCQESVLSKLGGYPKLCELYQLATSIELAKLLLDRQHPKGIQLPAVNNPGKASDPDENQEMHAAHKRIAELETQIKTIQEERLADLEERELNQQTFYEIQNYTDHVLMHVEGGSWCNLLPEFPPEGNCKKGQISISFEEYSPFVETVCCSCPLDMVAKIIIARKFGVEPKEQIVSTVGSDNSSEEQLTNTSRTLTDLRKSDTAEDRVVQIKVRIASAMTIQDEDLKAVSSLGTGSYGKVSKCLHTKTNRLVAVKSLHDLIRSEFNNNRFQQEATISSRLRHPNIVSCLGTCVNSTGGLQIVSELMEMSLRQLLARKSLSFQEIIALSLGIARGMSALHKRTVMHRDLSSNNVLLDSRGTPKITDFGVAHVLRTTFVSTLTNGAGTPPYVAPQMYTHHYGIQGDMWEFAVLLGEMLKGTVPDSRLPKVLSQISEFMRIQRASLSPLDVAEVNRLCSDPEVGEMAIAECLGRRNTILEALRCEPKFNNIPLTCVRIFALVIESCLSILENNRPPFSAIEKQLMTCAQLAFCPSADDDNVDACVKRCLADL